MKIYGSSARWLTLSVLAISVTSIHAQSSVRLPDAVVTATRVAQPVTEIVADVSTIDRAEIERLGVTTVTQLLGRLPGIQAIGYGDSGLVYVRGAEARMTALYIDGVRVDSLDGVHLGGGAPWDLVPVSQIERVEVVRGPVSAVYGSAAMGGVVQIFTRRGQGEAALQGSVGVGSFNTQRASAAVSAGQGAWNYSLGVGYVHSDGYNTRQDLVHTPEREPLDQRSASLRLGYQLTADQRLELTTLDNQEDTRYVPWGGGNDYVASGRLNTAALTWQSQWSPNFGTRVALTRALVAKRDDAPNDYQTTTQGVLWENHLKALGGDFTAVLEQKRDAFEAQPTMWDPSIQGERTQRALALGYGATVGAHSVQVNARSDDDSVFGTYQTAGAAYAYRLATNWRASASTGSAFRAPTLEQLFGPYGSTALRPETNQSDEVALRYVDGATRFSAVAYRNEITNLISSSQTLATCAAGYFCYFNVGRASIQGTTLSASQQMGNVTLRGAADFLDPRDDVTGKTLSLRARRVLTLGLEVDSANWQWGAQWRGVGERFDDAANTQTLAAYDVLDLTASTTLNREWKLTARVDNATDQNYQEVGKFATPGRTLFVGLTWSQR